MPKKPTFPGDDLQDSFLRGQHRVVAQGHAAAERISKQVSSSWGVNRHYIEASEFAQMETLAAVKGFNKSMAEIAQRRDKVYEQASFDLFGDLNISSKEQVSATTNKLEQHLNKAMVTYTPKAINGGTYIHGADIKLGKWFNNLKKKELQSIFTLASTARAKGLTIGQQLETLQGMFNKSAGEARAIARTSMISVTGAEDYEIFKANKKIIGRVRRVETLDGVTCLICAGIDGKEWKTGSPNAIVGAVHIHCRGSLVPVTDTGIEFDRPSAVADFRAEAKRKHDRNPKAKKSWDELSRSSKNAKAFEVEKSYGAGAYKMTNERTTYETWFNRQPTQFKKDILGDSRYSLYSKGRYKVTEFATVEKGIKPLSSL